MFLSQFVKFLAYNKSAVILGIILLLAFSLRAENLLYNSPSNDEAIYVVVGQLGIFGGDWFFYNASTWLSGSQFLYPTMTAIAYVLHGIWASRMLSVLAGTALTLTTYFLTLEFSSPLKNKQVGGLIAATIAGTATTALYVSRLATMDAISFTVFFASIYILQRALNKGVVSGQKFFVSSVLLFLSALIKLSTVFYFPLLLAYGLIATKEKGRNLFVGYYVFPLLFSTSLYVIFNTSSILYFTFLQAGREKSSLGNLFQVTWQSIQYLLPLGVFSAIFAALYTPLKKWLFLLVAALWIIAIHISAMRLPTLDKHLELSVIFLAVLVGVGINAALGKIKTRMRNVFLVFILVYLSIFAYASALSLNSFNSLWSNQSEGNKVLATMVSKNDKVLTETGPATVLAIFPHVDIENITTFDYFRYDIVEGYPAYKAAVNDGYFNYIELESSNLPKSDSLKKMHDLITHSMDSNYESVYSDGKVTIYRRAF